MVQNWIGNLGCLIVNFFVGSILLVRIFVQIFINIANFTVHIRYSTQFSSNQLKSLRSNSTREENDPNWPNQNRAESTQASQSSQPTSNLNQPVLGQPRSTWLGMTRATPPAMDWVLTRPGYCGPDG